MLSQELKDKEIPEIRPIVQPSSSLLIYDHTGFFPQEMMPFMV